MLRRQFKQALLLGIAFGATAAVVKTWQPQTIHAASAWLLPTARPGLEIFANAELEPRPDHNIDCFWETGIIRDARSVPPIEEQTIEGCAIYTPYATFLQQHLRLNNSRLYGRVSESVWPIPNSRAVLRFFGGSSHARNAYLIPNLPRHLEPLRQPDGSLSYQIAGYQAAYLRDKRGGLLNIDHHSVSVSENGDWLLVSTFQGIARIHIDSQQVLLFDQPFRYHTGIAPDIQTAISSDGRYVAVASTSFSRFRIYDLNSCEIVLESSIDRRACAYLDLQPLLPPAAGQGVSFKQLRFRSPYSLSFYRQEKFVLHTKTDHYTVTAFGHQAPRFEYLALGDSFTSGDGAYEYRDGTDVENNRCRLSSVSYPYLIKRSLSLTAAESIACSGAKLHHVAAINMASTQAAQASGKEEASYNQEIFEKFLPGYRPQQTFVSRYRPKVVTVSIGGNDIGFGDKLRSCVGVGTCFSTYEDRLEAYREVNQKFQAFAATFRSLKQAAPPETLLYAIGYPELAKNGGTCGLNVRLNAQEVIFSNLLIEHLNGVIEQAAKAAGVMYVDVKKAFEGHRLCETTYSNTAVNGLTAGNDTIDWLFIHGPIGSESYHPNALGHRLLHRAILEATDNFMKRLDLPENIPTHFPENDSAAILQAPKTYRQVRSLIYSPAMTPEIVIKTQPLSIRLVDDSLSLQPGSSAIVKLDSSANDMASGEVDDDGRLVIPISLPASLSAGFHTLHIHTLNAAGEPVDLYKTVYFAEDETDIDGDGLLNTQDPCVIFPWQTTDQDRDKIDDACDGSINQVSAPTLSSATSPTPRTGTTDALSQATARAFSEPRATALRALPATLGRSETLNNSSQFGSMEIKLKTWRPIIFFATLIALACLVLIFIRRVLRRRGGRDPRPQIR